MDEAPKELSAPPSAEPESPIPRRGFLKAGLGGVGLLGAGALGVSLDGSRSAGASAPPAPKGHPAYLMPGVMGEVDHAKNGFNPQPP